MNTLTLIVVLVAIAVIYSFIIYRIERKRDDELNASLRLKRKVARCEKVSVSPAIVPALPPVHDVKVLTYRGFVNDLSEIKKAKIGDVVFFNGKNMYFSDKGKWETIEGLI